MMHQIHLSGRRGGIVLVDGDDYERLMGIRWYADGRPGRLYARHGHKDRGERFMHRIIMRAAPGQLIDHINGDTFDNRRANLRFCDHSESVVNRRIEPSQFGYRGVHLGRGGKYYARLHFKGATYEGPSFTNPLAAAEDYDRLARFHHCAFAVLNFPDASVPGADAGSRHPHDCLPETSAGVASS